MFELEDEDIRVLSDFRSFQKEDSAVRNGIQRLQPQLNKRAVILQK